MKGILKYLKLKLYFRFTISSKRKKDCAVAEMAVLMVKQ